MTRQFEIGDKVICVNCRDRLVLGKLYTVRKIMLLPNTLSCMVALEEYPGLWDATRFVLLREPGIDTTAYDQALADIEAYEEISRG